MCNYRVPALLVLRNEVEMGEVVAGMCSMDTVSVIVFCLLNAYVPWSRR